MVLPIINIISSKYLSHMLLMLIPRTFLRTKPILSKLVPQTQKLASNEVPQRAVHKVPVAARETQAIDKDLVEEAVPPKGRKLPSVLSRDTLCCGHIFTEEGLYNPRRILQRPLNEWQRCELFLGR